MNIRRKKTSNGVTLLEVLLVLVILSALILFGIQYIQERARQSRLNRASLQVQQILNAGLAYYVSQGMWPVTPAGETATSQLGAGTPNIVPAYLPALNSPWNTPYLVSATNTLFFVKVQVTSDSEALVLAGRLPMAKAVATEVTASENIPPLILNKLTNVSEAGIYRNGACIPTPDCPVNPAGVATPPLIEVMPASSTGLSDSNVTNGYPLISFTAFAVGPVDTAFGGPPSCNNSADTSTACYANTWGGALLPAGTYWRVCMDVVTSKGKVIWNNATGEYAQIVVFTRCDVNAKRGSSFTVWAP